MLGCVIIIDEPTFIAVYSTEHIYNSSAAAEICPFYPEALDIPQFTGRTVGKKRQGL